MRLRETTVCRREKSMLARVALERVGMRVALAALLIGAACCGCRTLSGRYSPKPQTVATCRELTEQGISAMDRGDWKRAESLLARAVKTCAVDVDARRQYAEALWHRGALREALTQLEEARRLLNTDPALAVRAGEVYQALGQSGRAAQLADEALRLDPKFAPAWALHGNVAESTGNPRRALAHYQRALGYDPHNRDVAIQVAEVYRQLNEPERALLALQAVEDRCTPGSEPQRVLYLEGLALAALGRNDEAVGRLTRATTVDRPSPEILCALAEAQWATGDSGSAQTCVQQALALDPNHAASRALSTRLATQTPADVPLAR